jgi:hypothetical protein
MGVGGQRHAQSALTLTNQTFILTKLHGATSQQTLTFIFTSVETKYVTKLIRFYRKYTCFTVVSAVYQRGAVTELQRPISCIFPRVCLPFHQERQ